jgi:hypothetical protein
MKNGQVARLLAHGTGLVNQQLLLQNEVLQVIPNHAQIGRSSADPLPPRSPNLNAFAERLGTSQSIITTNAITTVKRTDCSFQYAVLYDHALNLR